MKILAPNKVLIECAAELPDAATTCEYLHLDHETTSFQFDEHGNRPYADHRTCGTAVTWDDHPRAYYIPVRHNVDGDFLPGNINLEAYQRWLQDVMRNRRLKRWSNANIKFDAHFSLADGAELPRVGGPEMWCTTTHAKLLDTDRLTKGGYGLDKLADWLLPGGYTHLADFERVKAYLGGLKRGGKLARDYGHVAVDIMGAYACGDVLTDRLVETELRRRCPESACAVWCTETLLTPVLFDMERDGETVDEERLDRAELELLVALNTYEEVIEKKTGRRCVPSKSSDCYELLCATYGLPVLSWTQDDNETGEEAGQPSFDYDALVAYSALPEVSSDQKLSWLVAAMMDYRDKNTLLTYFVRPYKELHVNGVMHPDYDQAKRTGRLGCRKPNMQQLSPEAKDFIIPGPGQAHLCCDYSQIEFRLLVHYMNDATAVAAYHENPDTDFHQWVADMCGIHRKPAKNVNFCMGYGGGKGKVVRMLSSDKLIVGKLGDEARAVCEAGSLDEELYRFCGEVVRRGGDQRKKEDPKVVLEAATLMNLADNLTAQHQPLVFRMLCKRRGEEVYETYHRTLPGLKRESRAAAGACAARATLDMSGSVRESGWVSTPCGRQRHLPPRFSWLAMNSVTQGWAADIIKERTVALAPRYNAKTRELGIKLQAQVHDENRFVGPISAIRSAATVRHVTSIMERPQVAVRVPLRSSASISDRSWREASDDKHPAYQKTAIDRTIAESPEPALPQVEC